MSLLLRNCNIVDATSPQVRRDQYVLVEGNTVVNQQHWDTLGPEKIIAMQSWG